MGDRQKNPVRVGIAEQLQDMVLESAEVANMLDELVKHAAATLAPGHAVLCGITLVRKKLRATVATSAPQVKAVDELQYNFGDGPCLTALREEVTVYVPDLDRERRWPRYCAVAWSEGIGSILSIPLPLDNDAGAAINLYAADREAFTDDDIASTQTYGAQASKSLRLAVRIAQLLSAQQNLEAAMRSCTIIDRSRRRHHHGTPPLQPGHGPANPPRGIKQPEPQTARRRRRIRGKNKHPRINSHSFRPLIGGPRCSHPRGSGVRISLGSQRPAA
ncbi:GAF domain-containing protein [Pseudarthrobacter enclensis]|uniref:GAF domain-containing protein n=1 Tax=Pseudarthrobacter enclensis TaxID=993070 RepID=A0ABT9RYY2_9MICC|nr:hypothetical protein [Pseudarthrobacter enclensis]